MSSSVALIGCVWLLAAHSGVAWVVNQPRLSNQRFVGAFQKPVDSSQCFPKSIYILVDDTLEFAILNKLNRDLLAFFNDKYGLSMGYASIYSTGTEYVRIWPFADTLKANQGTEFNSKLYKSVRHGALFRVRHPSTPSHTRSDIGLALQKLNERIQFQKSAESRVLILVTSFENRTHDDRLIENRQRFKYPSNDIMTINIDNSPLTSSFKSLVVTRFNENLKQSCKANDFYCYFYVAYWHMIHKQNCYINPLNWQFG